MGLFGKSLESNGDFSMRCQCLTSNLLRRYVGKCVFLFVCLECGFISEWQMGVVRVGLDLC